MKRMLVITVAALALCACLFALVGCGSTDKKDIQGVWLVDGSTVTVVYTEDELKMVGLTYGYSLNPGKKTITYTYGSDKGEGTYELADGKLTITQTDADGTEQVSTFTKVSDDVEAEPQADYGEEE